ncbi:hypothetical protein SDC9_182282 [bioreactor metagenome]|uniref:Uncharacterized protein n=1 Tax=bioreactor metagenome TaxID=1076179 RepID=A0A645H748_9ZZZZ
MHNVDTGGVVAVQRAGRLVVIDKVKNGAGQRAGHIHIVFIDVAAN